MIPYMKPQIAVETIIHSSIEKVWDAWTMPEHITKWCQASDGWHAPSASNDLRVGGIFTTRMEARDGSAGFDFGGTYTNVELYKKIEYIMEDGRKVSIGFTSVGGEVKVVEMFDPENQNPEDVQRAGWQAILNNFKHYVEADT